jgi:cytochrome c oxidase subunit 1
MFLSLIGFGFLGGISGVMMGTEQLNLIIHNTIYVPGHFHATVVIGTTLAFMGLTYFLIPTLFRRELMFPTMAKWQPYLFGLGMMGFAVFMMGAGTLGVPRRHWDVTFAGNPLGYDGWAGGTAWLMIAAFAICGLAAIVGGVMYLLITVGSVFLGKKIVTPGFAYVRAKDGVAPAAKPVEIALQAHGTNIGTADVRARARLPDRVRPLLLRELEIPLDRLAVELKGTAIRASAGIRRRSSNVAGSPPPRGPRAHGDDR